MPKLQYVKAIFGIFSMLTLKGQTGGGVTVLMRDGANNILFATGTTVPGDVSGYAKGAIFIDTDVADGTGGMYLNKGTIASANFTLVTQA